MSRPTFIFDYDGTLCDTLDAISESLGATFLAFAGESPAAGQIKALIGAGKTLDASIRALRSEFGQSDGEVPPQWIEFYRRHYALHAQDKVGLFDGVPAGLGRLAQLGNLVLLSNKGLQAVEASLRRFEIRRHFELVLAEEPGQASKPDPEVFWRRIAPVMPGLDASDCVVVGDTVTDLQFAKSIGAQACFARYGYGDAAACEMLGFTHDLHRFADLVAIYATAD